MLMRVSLLTATTTEITLVYNEYRYKVNNLFGVHVCNHAIMAVMALPTASSSC